jgi:hypothetical protein
MNANKSEDLRQSELKHKEIINLIDVFLVKFIDDDEETKQDMELIEQAYPSVELSAEEIELLKLALAQFDKRCNFYPNEKEKRQETDMEELLRKLDAI